MPKIENHPPGTFCWWELATSDAAGAKAFYRKLFGWTDRDAPMGPDAVYTTLLLGGDKVGALYQLNAEQKSQGIPPHWLTYVAVTNADETAARAVELGGTVLAGPFDVMEHGRMAILLDPAGASVGLWQPNQHRGSELFGEVGSVCWTELNTRDTEKASQFYSGLFGWKVDSASMEGYTQFQLGGPAFAGMFPLTPEMGDFPPFWQTYFRVEDCDAIAGEVERLGGTVLKEPWDIPQVGRLGIFKDPQGGQFAVIQTAM
jgi:uncharacterized protein